MIQQQSYVRVKDNIESYLNSIGFKGSDAVIHIGKEGNVTTIFSLASFNKFVKFAKIYIEEKKARQLVNKKFKYVVIRKKEIFNVPLECLEIAERPKDEQTIVKTPVILHKEARNKAILNCVDCNGKPKTYESVIGGMKSVICSDCLEIVSYEKPEKKIRKKKT